MASFRAVMLAVDTIFNAVYRQAWKTVHTVVNFRAVMPIVGVSFSTRYTHAVYTVGRRETPRTVSILSLIHI